jgi:hypothetical protein
MISIRVETRWRSERAVHATRALLSDLKKERTGHAVCIHHMAVTRTARRPRELSQGSLRMRIRASGEMLRRRIGTDSPEAQRDRAVVA